MLDVDEFAAFSAVVYGCHIAHRGVVAGYGAWDVGLINHSVIYVRSGCVQSAR